MAEILHLTEENFRSEVLESDTPVLVDFYADWCGPCRMLAPVIRDLNDDYDGSVKVAKLDVDAVPAIAHEFGVMSIPTVILFVGGRPADRVMGFEPKAHLKDRIARALAPAA
jgi:thioredoxin 1